MNCSCTFFEENKKVVKIPGSNIKPTEDKEMMWKHIVRKCLLFGVLCTINIIYNEWCIDKSFNNKNLCKREWFCSERVQFIAELSWTITRKMCVLISIPLPSSENIIRKVIHNPVKNYAEKESNGFGKKSSLWVLVNEIKRLWSTERHSWKAFWKIDTNDQSYLGEGKEL